MDDAGAEVPTLTVFLTNRECPWRCVFCDLWKHTLERPVETGDIPAQVDAALDAASHAGGPPPRWIKLYNAGSFFDPGAIPAADHAALAGRLAGLDRVIVECHPALVGPRVVRFGEQLREAAGRMGHSRAPTLEVALGLESVNPAVYPRLNKQVTPESFARASGRLRAGGMAVRAFVLVQPPFEAPAEAPVWAARAARFALKAGARVVALIPVRPGNGALEALQARGDFIPPRLAVLESALDQALDLAADVGRIEADLWDLGGFSDCGECLPARRARLERANRTQRIQPFVACRRCAGSGAPCAPFGPGGVS